MLQFPRLISLFVISTQNYRQQQPTQQILLHCWWTCIQQQQCGSFSRYSLRSCTDRFASLPTTSQSRTLGSVYTSSQHSTTGLSTTNASLSQQVKYIFCFSLPLRLYITIRLNRSAAQMLYRDVGNIFFVKFPCESRESNNRHGDINLSVKKRKRRDDRFLFKYVSLSKERDINSILYYEWSACCCENLICGQKNVTWPDSSNKTRKVNVNQMV